jgi:hypothetical protein
MSTNTSGSEQSGDGPKTRAGGSGTHPLSCEELAIEGLARQPYMLRRMSAATARVMAEKVVKAAGRDPAFLAEANSGQTWVHKAGIPAEHIHAVTNAARDYVEEWYESAARTTLAAVEISDEAMQAATKAERRRVKKARQKAQKSEAADNAAQILAAENASQVAAESASRMVAEEKAAAKDSAQAAHMAVERAAKDSAQAAHGVAERAAKDSAQAAHSAAERAAHKHVPEKPLVAALVEVKTALDVRLEGYEKQVGSVEYNRLWEEFRAYEAASWVVAGAATKVESRRAKKARREYRNEANATARMAAAAAQQETEEKAARTAAAAQREAENRAARTAAIAQEEAEQETAEMLAGLTEHRRKSKAARNVADNQAARNTNSAQSAADNQATENAARMVANESAGQILAANKAAGATTSNEAAQLAADMEEAEVWWLAEMAAALGAADIRAAKKTLSLPVLTY